MQPTEQGFTLSKKHSTDYSMLQSHPSRRSQGEPSQPMLRKAATLMVKSDDRDRPLTTGGRGRDQAWKTYNDNHLEKEK